MKLYFFRLSDWDTFREAKQAGAVAEHYLEDVADPSLRKGAAADAVEVAILTTQMLAGETEPLQFILTTDDDKILDIF